MLYLRAAMGHLMQEVRWRRSLCVRSGDAGVGGRCCGSPGSFPANVQTDVSDRWRSLLADPQTLSRLGLGGKLVGRVVGRIERRQVSLSRVPAVLRVLDHEYGLAATGGPLSWRLKCISVPIWLGKRALASVRALVRTEEPRDAVGSESTVSLAARASAPHAFDEKLQLKLIKLTTWVRLDHREALRSDLWEVCQELETLGCRRGRIAAAIYWHAGEAILHTNWAKFAAWLGAVAGAAVHALRS